MLAACCGPLVRLQDTVNAKIYKQIILQQYAISQQGSSPFQTPTIMYDNLPCHTSKKLKSYLVDNAVQVNDLPAQSPDPNCIENIWMIIGYRTRTQNPKTRRTVGVLGNWMEQDYVIILQNLMDSCGKWCQKVVNSRRLFTIY